MVEYLPSKQATWVRFPSPALSRVDSLVEAGGSEQDIGGGAGVDRSNRAWGARHWRTNRARRCHRGRSRISSAAVAQSVERVLGKDEVLGSNPSGSFRVFGSSVHHRASRNVGPSGLGPRLLGWLSDGDPVGVWGNRATARRLTSGMPKGVEQSTWLRKLSPEPSRMSTW